MDFHTLRQASVVAALAVIAGACSPTWNSNSSTPQPMASKVVTSPEIRVSGGLSAFDGVRLLRPSLVVDRAAGSPRSPGRVSPVAYLDGTRLSSLVTLQLVHVDELESMIYLDASTATTRYGTGHQGGAIVVTTHRGG